MSRSLAVSALLLALCVNPLHAGTTPAAPETAASTPAPHLTRSARRGLAFAQTRCSGCHAIAANGTSPNPESPPFEAIANMRELTAATLRQFLSDSHNYPAAMNFTVARARIRDLSDYVLTLRRADYKPEI
jgi:mono/diheme cytochrome c family protein